MTLRTSLFLLLAVLLSTLPSWGQAPAAKPAGLYDGPPVKPEDWWPTQPRALPLVHPLFSDDMVLQREIAAPIWGWSTPGDKVVIIWDGKQVGEPITVGSEGTWKSKLGPLLPGGPHTLTVTGGKQSIALKNVLVGDVWLCSGQSNMNWPVRLSDNAEEEVKNANYPQIRSFNVGFYPALTPQKLPPPAKWEVCTPEFAKNFTGVGYFFAREIYKTQNIPIGIIHSSVGATYAEVWVSAEALKCEMPHDFSAELANIERLAAPHVGVDYFEAIEKWVAAVDPQSAAKKYAIDPNLDTSDWRDIAVPKPWEEAGLPDFDGLVWFRHELEVPAEWGAVDLQLSLAIVRDVDVVWFNGKLLGSKPTSGIRNYKIPRELVKPGKNLLVAAVLNREGPGGFCSAPSNMALRPLVDPKDRIVRPAGTWKMKQGPAISDVTLPFPTPPVRHYKTLSGMYNGMIAPLVPFGIKGALWYQGEANGPRWLQYRRLLPTLIADWRARFGVGDFPFLIVSLANLNKQQTEPIEPGWAELRESQWRTVRKVPNTGLAMTIDIGDPGNIHPKNKQEAGRRLSLVARRMVYGEQDLVDSGPEFTEMMVELPKGDKIRLYFKNLGGGLMIKPGDKKLTGFCVAGPDLKYFWADAVIDGDTVVVSSPDVEFPKHVRYGWAWNPIVNLYNKAGLPAITFRTDE